MPAVLDEVTVLSVCTQLFRAGPSTCCGCSGGGGSMARVWGAVSPARLALLLLLMPCVPRRLVLRRGELQQQMMMLEFLIQMFWWILILCLRGNPEALLVDYQNGDLSLNLGWMPEVLRDRKRRWKRKIPTEAVLYAKENHKGEGSTWD
ncbi:uncharacterized protein LOC107307584 isoform X3 [Coturnix japonica]|uniref:uncharacterized protein LOC107307584 isoform X3 n=1 Tax=Coturnix japonica TaxID=93934 RepID=UPI0013A5E191|nr:uncharacterized protein LOC107307584 isoform X3 [Coturnix japonica]